jgi:hypothetical protein
MTTTPPHQRTHDYITKDKRYLQNVLVMNVNSVMNIEHFYH